QTQRLDRYLAFAFLLFAPDAQEYSRNLVAALRMGLSSFIVNAQVLSVDCIAKEIPCEIVDRGCHVVAPVGVKCASPMLGASGRRGNPEQVSPRLVAKRRPGGVTKAMPNRRGCNSERTCRSPRLVAKTPIF